MCALATDRQSTIVRPYTSEDLRSLLRLVDTAWRVHLRISPIELGSRLEVLPCLLAEDRVGLRGFLMVEPMQPGSGLIVAAGIRDSWNVKPYLDLLLPGIEDVLIAHNIKTLLHIGSTSWLTDELQLRGFEVREQVISLERAGVQPPTKRPSGAAHIRTAHLNDLPLLTSLDSLAFEQNWHKRPRHFKEALASAASFSVAVVDNRIVAFEWTELYDQHAHLTRLAVHPDYQGQGIGRQLLYQAIVDALNAGADLITLNTQETNQRSRALYKRFDFIDTGLRMPVLWKSLELR